jgi:hypothetical protein
MTGQRCTTRAPTINKSPSSDGAVTVAAVEMLRPLGDKDPGTLGAIRNAMFDDAIAALTWEA